MNLSLFQRFLPELKDEIEVLRGSKAFTDLIRALKDWGDEFLEVSRRWAGGGVHASRAGELGTRMSEQIHRQTGEMRGEWVEGLESLGLQFV